MINVLTVVEVTHSYSSYIEVPCSGSSRRGSLFSFITLRFHVLVHHDPQTSDLAHNLTTGVPILPAPCSISQNPGKTSILVVLPPVAALECNYFRHVPNNAEFFFSLC